MLSINSLHAELTQRALNRGLYFRTARELVLISGAGIAGLAASFELRAKGFNVVVVEKRGNFSRFNIINLNVETRVFLKKHRLLKKFETFVASRIKEHRYVVVEKTNAPDRSVNDVRQLKLDTSIPFEPTSFTKLFAKDGIYSVPIGVLQDFLAENALRAGVHIFGNTELTVVKRRPRGGVARAQMTGRDEMLRPHLFFISEGSNSKTALQLGMRTRVVENECSGENWNFGNFKYFGKETFVISLIDTSKKDLRIANVIFNAKHRVINVAVTATPGLSIKKQLLNTLEQALQLEDINHSTTLLNAVRKPVHSFNRTAVDFSMDNVFRIGDAAGHSSPLAGLGGTLALSLAPLTVAQLLNDLKQQPKNVHSNFKLFSKAYTARWIEKSEKIKRFCLEKMGKHAY